MKPGYYIDHRRELVIRKPRAKWWFYDALNERWYLSILNHDESALFLGWQFIGDL